MKKIILTSVFALISLLAFNQTVTYSADLILADSSLENVHTKLTANSALNISGNGTIITVSGSSMRLTYSDLASIISNGGTIENYILVLKVPVGFESENVSSSLPDYTNAFGNTITYEYYFQNGNVVINGGNIYIQCVNYKGEILSGGEMLVLAQQARTWSSASLGALSNYILLISDSEVTALF